jgi:hypothetical protein
MNYLRAALLATILLLPIGVNTPALRYRFSSGTVIVMWIEDGAVILAADSRAMTDEGHADDDCKLLAFSGNIIFTSAGKAHMEIVQPYNAVWEARVVARQTIVRLPRNNNAEPARDIATALAASWGNAAKSYFGHILSLDGGADALRHVTSSYGVLIEGIFAVRGADGAVAVSHMLISLDSTKQGTTIKATPSILGPGFAVMGEQSIFLDYVPHPKNELAARQFKQWQRSVAHKSQSEQNVAFIGQLARWTVDAGFADVGGDVDEVMLNAKGVNWIHRKSVCPADSHSQNFDIGSKQKRK